MVTSAWCNGSIQVSKTSGLGSNPRALAILKFMPCMETTKAL